MQYIAIALNRYTMLHLTVIKVYLKRSAGVAPEMTLGNPSHAGDKECGSNLALKHRADVTKKCKTGVPVALYTKWTNILKHFFKRTPENLQFLAQVSHNRKFTV